MVEREALLRVATAELTTETVEVELARVQAWTTPFGLDVSLFQQQEKGQQYALGKWITLSPTVSRLVSLLLIAWPLYAAFNPMITAMQQSAAVTAAMCLTKHGAPTNLSLADCIACNGGDHYVTVEPPEIHGMMFWALGGILLYMMYSAMLSAYVVRDHALLMACRGVGLMKGERTSWLLVFCAGMVFIGATGTFYHLILLYTTSYSATIAAVACPGIMLHAVKLPLTLTSSVFAGLVSALAANLSPLLLAAWKLISMAISPYDVIGTNTIVLHKNTSFRFYAGVRYAIKSPDYELSYREILNSMTRGPGNVCRKLRRWWAVGTLFKVHRPPSMFGHEHAFTLAILADARARGNVRCLPVIDAPRPSQLPVTEPLMSETIRAVWRMLKAMDSPVLYSDNPPEIPTWPDDEFD